MSKNAVLVLLLLFSCGFGLAYFYSQDRNPESDISKDTFVNSVMGDTHRLYPDLSELNKNKQVINASLLKDEVLKCVREKNNQKQVCDETIKYIKGLVRSSDAKGLQHILNVVGVQESIIIREDLWGVVSVIEGDLGSFALREFYFDKPTLKPSTAFYPIVAKRFGEIATSEDLQIVIDAFVSEDKSNYRKAYSLLQNIDEERYPSMLADAFPLATEDRKLELFAKLTQVDNLEAYRIALSLISSMEEIKNEETLEKYLLKFNYFKHPDIKGDILSGVFSSSRIEYLSSIAAMKSFSKDAEVIKVANQLLSEKKLEEDDLAQIMLKAIVRK